MNRCRKIQITLPTLVGAAILLLVPNGLSQTQPKGATRTTVKEFYDNLVSRPEGSAPPTQSDLLNAVNQIYGMPAETMREALPSLFAALREPDIDVEIDAALALTEVSRRQDGVQLLAPYMASIVGMFDMTDPRL